MKAKLLNGFNALIAFLVTALGFGSCDGAKKYGPPPTAEYGVPYAEFEVAGNITDQNDQPLENIQVTVRSKYGDTYPEEYTDKDGTYHIGKIGDFPIDSLDIVVQDTSGIYSADSVRVKVEYNRSAVSDNDSSATAKNISSASSENGSSAASEDDHWNSGSAFIRQDFRLRKK